MPSVIPFFEKCGHKVNKIRNAYASRPRRAALSLALWSLGMALQGRLSGDIAYTKAPSSSRPLRMAAMLRGGIGDEIMSLAYLYELARHAGAPCSFDIFAACAPASVKCLCHGQPFISEVRSLKERIVFHEYDAVLDIGLMSQLKSLCKERVSAGSPFLLDYFLRLIRFQSAHQNFYQYENQALGLQYSDVMGTFRRGRPDFDGSLGLKDSSFTLNAPLGADAITQRFDIGQGYITLQREAGVNPESTKLWASSKYTELISALCNACPGRHIVLLGMEKNFEVPAGASGSVADLRGRTSFSEFISLVKHAALHIGCEGVVPHLRHFLRGGRSVVLFGPASSRMLGYPENIAVSSGICPNGCENIETSWQDACLKGFPYCHAMDAITVDMVMEAVGNCQQLR